MSNASQLNGKTIAVTRAESQAGGFSGSLVALGARVLSIPAIEIVAPDDESVIEQAILELDTYSWIIFTSVNAVDRFYYYLALAGISELNHEIRCAAVGSATAAALAEHGVACAMIPLDYKAEGLMEEFDRIVAQNPQEHLGQKILMPRALKAREILPEHLRELGYVVTVAPVYKTVPATLSDEQIDALSKHAHQLDAVTFTSPSTAKNFFAALEKAGIVPAELFKHTYAFSIGDVTTRALLELGVQPEQIKQAEESTVKSLISALQLI